MDLVEKAAQRLAQLQKAGVEVPAPEAAGAQVPPVSPGAESIPTPERFAQALERTQPSDAPRVTTPAPARAAAFRAPGHRSRAPAEAGPRSKVVHIDLEALGPRALLRLKRSDRRSPTSFA